MVTSLHNIAASSLLFSRLLSRFSHPFSRREIDGRDHITPYTAIFTWYIRGMLYMYYQLGGYVLPTTRTRNYFSKNPLTQLYLCTPRLLISTYLAEPSNARMVWVDSTETDNVKKQQNKFAHDIEYCCHTLLGYTLSRFPTTLPVASEKLILEMAQIELTTDARK